MAKKQRIVFLLILILMAISACCLARIDPPADSPSDKSYPPEFFCAAQDNPMDLQTDGNCASYAAAYVLRSLGVQTDGEEIAPEMRRIFGFVPARSIVTVLEARGLSAEACRGDVDTLKHRLSAGTPVIVFVSIPGDTHYAVVVGYDPENLYLVDSLAENRNADDSRYNRKLTTREFERIWRTDTVLSDNIYIVADGHSRR